MNIVILDGHTINPGDLSWDPIGTLGKLTVYDKTEYDQLYDRLKGTSVFLTSKVTIDENILEKLPQIEYIGSTATGYNNIDINAAAKRGIAVTNVPAYSTEAVAQHTFSLILEITGNTGLHNDSVKRGEWTSSKYFCYWKKPLLLLAGKSLGIIGYGNIGRRVAEIAKAFGMTVNIYSRDKKACLASDIVTLHCPLTPDNAGFIDKDTISAMKDGAILINTSRGGLINEKDLALALNQGKLYAAAVDVLEKEPPSSGDPLINCSNCIVTPHIAWAPSEMRKAVIDTCAANLESYFKGGCLNRVEKKEDI